MLSRGSRAGEEHRSALFGRLNRGRLLSRDKSRLSDDSMCACDMFELAKKIVKIWTMQPKSGQKLACCLRTSLSLISIRRCSMIKARTLVTIEIKLMPRWLLQSLRLSLLKMSTNNDSTQDDGTSFSSQIPWSKEINAVVRTSPPSYKRTERSSSGPGDFARFSNQTFYSTPKDSPD